MSKHTKIIIITVMIIAVIIPSLITGCSLRKMTDIGSDIYRSINKDNSDDKKKSDKNDASKDKGNEGSSGVETITYRDVEGNEFVMDVDPDVKKHDYDLSKLKHREGSDKISFDDGKYTIRKGVDVSHHNGVVDWEKVKKAGYTFAFLRLGYRGYGKDGQLMVDREFQSSFKRARAAGMKLGVYFFSQAINEKEAVEEAKLVLRELNNSKLDLPVVFDPENIKNDEARTDNVDGDQFTKNTLAFSKVIKEAGYKPAIYCNMHWEDQMLDLGQLSDLPIWYADYCAKPQTPYRFTFWQYSESGKVDGISGNADLNVWFVKTGKNK
ncbi:MAG: glycoside hydrolase family 25 protein [Eubacterium sp.]|nr:glycoside hydrolase family 25 protein [Eubacterium sp.]